ncbi:uncharacterized protein LOC130974953 [Arachis stenosperma]|uniref:uncharacterized protein LOC130974953 n=1 Tax=Arachis stenosperma TaxID=217475 RepID=UPI0025AB602E|nr:uncharacterized protein LOC130974953 [Arachis stenosperma]
MTRSLPDLSLGTFNPEIERTISRIRQARRRLFSEGDEGVIPNLPVLSDGESDASFEEETSSSSTDSVDLSAEPIKHLRDFQTTCSTARRHGAEERAVWLYALPFSLEGKAKEWFYTQPKAIVTNWDLLRRKFLDKYFPAEVTVRLRKEISSIIQGEAETLYEYWERIRNLLDLCPHPKINHLVLISYFFQGMKPQNKTLLDATSNGSLTKYKTVTKAWQLITDLAESTRNTSQRTKHPKVITEVSSNSETAALTQTLGEMTNILKQLQLNQQQPLPPLLQHCQQLVPQRVCGICACYSYYTDECLQLQQEDNTLAATHNFYDLPNQGYYQQGGWSNNYNQGGRDNDRSQRWNNNNNYQQNWNQQNAPYRAPHQRQAQAPQFNQQQAPQITYLSSSSNDEMLCFIAQGQKDIQNTFYSTINGLNSILQALISRLEPPSTPNNQPSSSNALPSQPLPNPKGGINAITLRSGTTLQERSPEESSSKEDIQVEDIVEVEDVEEEDEVQGTVAKEVAQSRNGVPKEDDPVREAIPIPFPHLARKTKKQMELDPKMRSQSIHGYLHYRGCRIY